MAKKLVLVAVFVIVLSLVAGVGVMFAQGGGNGNGNNGQGQGNGIHANGGVGILNEDGTFYQRGQGRNNANRGFGIISTLPTASDVPLTDELIDLMTDGIMDEYHAYAVYGSVIEQFGDVRPFTAIQAAEAQHIESWAFLFERYGLDVPTAPESFDLPQFASVADACQIAADAEIANFELYDEMYVAFADYPDIQQVVTALRNASEYNHLPAFEGCAQ